MHGIPAHLMELAAEQQAVYDALADGVDEGDEEALAVLKGMLETSQAKTAEMVPAWLGDCGMIEDAVTAEIEAHKGMAKQIRERAARAEKALANFRRHIHEAMALFGITEKVKTRSGTWYTSTRKGQLDIYSELDLPTPEQDPSLYRVKHELDKDEVKRRLAADPQSVPGARLIDKDSLNRRK